MPLCRISICSLLHSRDYTRLARIPHRPTQWSYAFRSYSIPAEQHRKHDTTDELDLSKLPADSAYLDFILGPADREREVKGAIKSSVRIAEHEYEGRRSEDIDEQDSPSSLTGRHRQRDAVSLPGHQHGLRRSRSSALRTSSLRTIPAVESLRRSESLRDGEVETTADGFAQSDENALSSSHYSSQPVDTSTESKPNRNSFLRLKRLWPSRCRYLANRKEHDAKTANANLNTLRARGSRIRTKYVSLRSAGIEFSSNWNREFAKLQSHYDKSVPDDYLKVHQASKLHKDAKKWAEEVLMAMEQGELSVVNDVIGPRLGWSRRWQQIALWILHHQPTKMVEFLRVTHVSPLPPMTYVRDSLQYLVTHFTHCEGLVTIQQLSAVADVFPLLVQRVDRTRFWMDGSFFRHLISHCTDVQIVQLYRSIRKHHVQTSWFTYLHFSTYFAKYGHFEQGLDAVLEAKRAQANLGSYAFRSTCATLLRSSIREPNGLRVCLRIVDNLVRIGLTLNNTLCNIVMLNAVEAGDLQTAFSIYHSLVQHGLEADAYTYAILLKGCKAVIDDAETLNMMIRSAIDHINVLQEPIVAAEILHCLALHHRKHQPHKAFEIVVDAYAQLYDLEPLHKLGLPLPNFSQSSHPSEKKLQPGPQVLGILLPTYLDHALEVSRSTLPAYELYQRYRTLAETSVEPFVSSIETDHVANAFLMSFIQTKKGLLYAAEVVKDMQKASDPGSPRHRCQPTVQTWSIFLHGFTRHGQMKLAEQVFGYMRKKNIQPNQITWNTLAAGYAGSQDYEGMLDSLRRMEADGATWDQWTVGGVRKLRDQERLRLELQRREQAADLDFTSDLKRNLGEKIAAADGLLASEQKPSSFADSTTADSAGQQRSIFPNETQS